VKGRLEDMTWPDVAAAVAGGVTTVVLPLGATEQHGHHLPIGTDSFRAAALAERLAGASLEILVAPVLPFGCSDEHSGFAGLLSLDHQTLASVIVDCARRMAGWGACRLILLSAHGGNARALGLAATRLRDELPGLQVVALGASDTLSDAILALAAADGIAPEAVGLHAGEGETSEMLAIRPDLVRLDRAVPGYVGPIADVMPQLKRQGLQTVTSTGTLGDPSGADGRRGARYLAAEAEGCRRLLTQAPAAKGGSPA
jgi:mycofactocin system creatininase family protein